MKFLRRKEVERKTNDSYNITLKQITHRKKTLFVMQIQKL